MMNSAFLLSFAGTARRLADRRDGWFDWMTG
jgi:hypothetical protein